MCRNLPDPVLVENLRGVCGLTRDAAVEFHFRWLQPIRALDAAFDGKPRLHDVMLTQNEREDGRDSWQHVHVLVPVHVQRCACAELVETPKLRAHLLPHLRKDKLCVKTSVTTCNSEIRSSALLS